MISYIPYSRVQFIKGWRKIHQIFLPVIIFYQLYYNRLNLVFKVFSVYLYECKICWMIDSIFIIIKWHLISGMIFITFNIYLYRILSSNITFNLYNFIFFNINHIFSTITFNLFLINLFKILLLFFIFLLLNFKINFLLILFIHF